MEDVAALEQEISREDEPSVYSILEVQNLIKEAYAWAIDKLSKSDEDENEDNEEDASNTRRVIYLVKNSLPYILKNILRKKIYEDEIRHEILKLLKFYIRLIIVWHPFEVEEVIKMLTEIFYQDSKFYQDIGYQQCSPKELKRLLADAVGDYTCVPKYNPGTPDFVRLVEYYGEHGGFDLVLERLKGKISLHKAVIYLDAIEMIRKYVKLSYFSSYADELKDCVFTMIQSMNAEQLKQTPKSAIVNSCENLYYILSTTIGCEESGRIIETFQLSVAEMCFLSPILEKRLFGLKTITSFILMAEKKEKKSSILNSQKKIRSTRWIETDFLVNWIEEHKIVEELFGNRMHHELLSRSCGIFIFLAEKNRLKLEDLDLIWKATQDKPEFTVAALYDIIKQLLPYLQIDYMVKVLSFLQGVPVKDYNTMILSLLKQFTECYLSKDIEPEVKVVPLNQMWDVVQDQSGVSDDIFNETMNSIKELFQNSLCDNLNNIFIDKCIKNIKSSQSVPQSLIIFRKVLEMIPSKQLALSNPETSDSILDKLRLEYKIVDVIFEDLEKYKKHIGSVAVNTSFNNNFTLPGKYYPHLQSIQIRLNFLQFLMTNCPLSINESHVTVLWNTVVKNPLTPEEKNVAFDWLSDTCEKYLFDPKIVEYIFDQYLSNLEYEDLGETEFKCFEIFFRYVNVNLGNIVIGERERFKIRDYNLVGLESLWRLALNVLNSTVADQAIEYIKYLYNTYCLELEATQTQIKQEFITRVMDKIRQATSVNLSVGVDKCDFRLKRCITLLQKFVDPTSPVFYRRNPNRKPTRLSVVGESASYQVIMRMNDKYSLLVQKLSNKLLADKPDKAIQTSFRGATATQSDYEKTIEELELVGTTISFKIVNKETFDREFHSSEDLNSAKFLLSSNPEYINQLFSILDYSEDISDSVWDLLEQIPTNPETKLKLKNIDNNTKWDEILNTHSTYKLLYYLQLIKSIATEVFDSQKDQEKQALWYSNFVSSGGFEHIFNIFLHNNEAVVGRLKVKCLEFLLQLINTFILEKDNEKDIYSLKNEWLGLDFKSLITNLLDVLWYSAKSAPISKSLHSDLMKNGSSLLIAVFFTKPELISCMYNYLLLEEFTKGTLLESPSSECRKEISNVIVSLCNMIAPISEEEKHPRQYFIPLLLKFLPSIPAASQLCSEYFNTLILLIHSNNESADQFSAKIQYNELNHLIIKLIQENPTIEKDGFPEKDYVFIGLSSLLAEILSIHKEISFPIESLLNFLFIDCLFSIPERNNSNEIPPKCKSQESRKAAYNLLKQLIYHKTELVKYEMDLIDKNHLSQVSRYTDWSYSPSSEQRSTAGYVGLKNLGCICYMNSLLQQLFMMPKFRKGILSLDEIEDTEDSPKVDNIPYQMQVMFSYLQESKKQYYNPIHFCRANKDYDGNPTDVRVQMDVDEFFNVLCDKLECYLRTTRQEKLLKNIWCGNMCTQFICKICKCISERDEPFYTLGVEIKNRNDIEEALEDIIKGEMLEGDNAYMCERCDKKVDALMRRCIKTLPNTLIVLLKRFEFNFDTMRKLKLNDYCKFPHELNMERFTKEGIAKADIETALQENRDPPITEGFEEYPPNYYQYKLVGILVHMGVADSGHYYSFIKERVSPNGSEPQWFEFNDEIVRPFDPSQIEHECFGGNEEVGTELDDSGNRVPRIISKSRNAYMLIYERDDEAKATNNSDHDQVLSSPSQSDDAQCLEMSNGTTALDTLQLNKLQDEKAKEKVDPFTADVPHSLYLEVWKENIQFFMDKLIFDQDYFIFFNDMVDIISSVPRKQQLKLLKIAVKFTFEVIARSKEKELFAKVLHSFEPLISSNRPALKWILESLVEESWIRMFFFECPIKDIRTAFANFISKLLEFVKPFEDIEDDVLSLKMVSREVEEFSDTEVDDDDDYDDDDDDDDDDDFDFDEIDQQIEEGPLTIMIAEKFFRLGGALPTCWRTVPQYFLVLKNFALISHLHREFLLRKGIIYSIYDLMHRITKKQKRAKTSVRIANTSTAIELLEVMIRSSSFPRYIDNSYDDEEDIDVNIECPFALDGDKIDIPFSQLEAIQDDKFIKSVVEDERNVKAIGSILQFWSWENPQQTDSILRTLKFGVHHSEYHSLAPWFGVIDMCLEICDQLSDTRTEFLLSSIVNTAEKFKKYPKFSKSIFSQTKKLKEKNAEAADWFAQNPSKWRALKDIKLQHTLKQS